MNPNVIDEPAYRNRKFVFKDRLHAGELLANKLQSHMDGRNVQLLAIPAGGVPVGYVVAKKLNVPLDVILVRKIQIPWNPEAGFGEHTKNGRNLPLILEHAWQMKKDGKAEETIIRAVAELKRLATLCNIDDPEQVKAVLAEKKCKNGTKQITTQIISRYYKYRNITWQPPEYKREQSVYFIPTEQEIDALIASASLRMATLLQLLKETGARIGEIPKLLWVHIDLERRTINITAEKGSNSRILPISTKLIDMLNKLPRKTKETFPSSKHSLRTNFESLRNRTANKLGNPRLKQIHLHTFRHWKGTIEYHKTKDIIHVKTILGHKNVESTMVYINLEQAIFLTQSDEYTCKVATNQKEIIELIETGFEYITEMDGMKYFRKRK